MNIKSGTGDTRESYKRDAARIKACLPCILPHVCESHLISGPFFSSFRGHQPLDCRQGRGQQRRIGPGPHQDRRCRDGVGYALCECLNLALC